MIDRGMNHDEQADPVVTAALQQAFGVAPLEEVDWTMLRRSINERAALPLARRRHAAPRPVAVRWGRPLLPLAAAASIALAVWLGGLPGPDGGTGQVRQVGASAAFPTAEQVLKSDLPEAEFRQFVSGRADPEALLQIAIDES